MEQKKFTPSICRKVLRLIQGETLPSSLFPRWFADELKEEGLLSVITHGSRNSYRLLDVEASIRYVKNKYTGGAELSRKDFVATAKSLSFSARIDIPS